MQLSDANFCHLCQEKQAVVWIGSLTAKAYHMQTDRTDLQMFTF